MIMKKLEMRITKDDTETQHEQILLEKWCQYDLLKESFHRPSVFKPSIFVKCNKIGYALLHRWCCECYIYHISSHKMPGHFSFCDIKTSESLGIVYLRFPLIFV